MTREEMDFIGGMNMCDEISNEAYKKIMCHCEELEPCEDCISREDAMSMILCYGNEIKTEVMNDIKASMIKLPSVTPQPKTGKWIYDRTRDWDGECKYECSECGMGSDVDYAYCMRCGAKMEVSE